MKSFFLALLLSVSFASVSLGQSDGFDMLFNGKDLTGWSYLPTTEAQKKGRANWQRSPDAPPWPIVKTKVNFDGKAKSEDGRFVAEDGVLVVSVPPEGRKIQMLYSDAEVKGDFEMRLEFRAAENADSGVFIRGRQLQCRDYPNAGPYKKLKKFKPNDWNELVVVVEGETARCTCNGEVLEESFKVPAEGPIGVEGDRGKLEYRNIRIQRAAPNNVASPGNLLKPVNDIASWHFEQHENGKGTIAVEGDSIVFETTVAGSEAWHVQAFQTGLDLEEGAEYKVSFEIKGDREDVRVVLLGSINEEDWHGIELHREMSVSKDFEKQQVIFWPRKVVKGNNRIGFILGSQKATVTVRNLELRKAK
jgi:hypothetical protein